MLRSPGCFFSGNSWACNPTTVQSVTRRPCIFIRSNISAFCQNLQGESSKGEKKMKKVARAASALLLLLGWWFATTSQIIAQTKSQEEPYVVEYYYKAKWGYADEF